MTLNSHDIALKEKTAFCTNNILFHYGQTKYPHYKNLENFFIDISTENMETTPFPNEQHRILGIDPTLGTATTMKKNHISVWDLATKNIISVHPIDEFYDHSATGYQYFPGEELLLISSYTEIVLWDIVQSKPIDRILSWLDGIFFHECELQAVAGEKNLLAIGDENHIYLRNYRKKEWVDITPRLDSFGIGFSQNGDKLISYGMNRENKVDCGVVECWSCREEKLSLIWRNTPGLDVVGASMKNTRNLSKETKHFLIKKGAVFQNSDPQIPQINL